MPNVIVEVQNEISRVRKMLPLLEPERRLAAAYAIEFAETSLAMNSYEEMREGIDGLREFQLPPVIEE